MRQTFQTQSRRKGGQLAFESVYEIQVVSKLLKVSEKKEHGWISQRLPDILKELTFMGVATTNGASGESLTANLSCMKRLSTIDSSLRTTL